MESGQVDLSELTWEQKEQVLRCVRLGGCIPVWEGKFESTYVQTYVRVCACLSVLVSCLYVLTHGVLTYN